MTTETITQLPLAISISGSESIEIVQGGTSKQTTTGAIAGLAAAAGTVTQIDTNAPLNGGPITTTGTISLQSGGVTNQYLANMPTLTVKANITGGTAQPTDVTAAAFISAFGVGTVTSVGSGAGLTGGPITTTGTLSLTTTGVTAGTYGSTTAVGQFTVDAYGRLTSATNQTINIPSGQVSGLGTMATQNANNVAITGGAINGTIIGGTTPAAATFTALTATGTTNLSTIASGTWNGTAIGVSYGGTGASTASGARTNLGAAASGANSDITSLSGLTTPLSAPQGGTGFGSYTTGDILYADTSSTLARLNDVATGNALISGGVGVAPSWGKIGLTTHVSGTLPVANGGSGATTLTGFLKGNGTSPFTAQATINNADLTNSSITIGSTTLSLGGSTSTISGLTTLTLTQDPTSALQASTKQYVDGQVLAVSNTTFHTAAYVATTADLGTVTYNNGTGGVGATITNSGAQAALTIDGYTFTASDVTNATRVLVKDQTSGLQNGIYIVTNQGSGSTNWQLQRSTDFNTTGTGPNYIQTGAGVFVTSGTVWGSTSWVMNTTGTINVGSTALNWVQTSSAGNFSVTAPLQKTGNVISLNTVGVAYGGTGLTTLTAYGLLYAPTTSSVAQISPSTAGQPLLSTGPSSPASFGALSLSGAGVTGTLGVSNGGTGTGTVFTTGSVVFSGASGVYSQDAELFWDNTNKWLGIGTNTPRAELTIVSPTQTYAPSTTLPAGTDLYIVGANSANTRITQDAYGTGNYPAYTGRQARGTAASPTASQTGDILAQYTGRGYGATAFASASNARIDMEAAENYTDTAQGTYISMHTTALGAASPVERFRVGPSGQWGIGGGTYGTSGYAFVSGGASAAPTWSQISLTAGVTGTLPATNGGTGQSTYTIGDLLYASSSSALSRLADVATGNVLLSGGVGVAPSWGKVDLTTAVNGTLPVANGGTGQASALTQYGVVYGSTTSAMATTAAGTTGQVLIANTGGAPTWSSTIPSTAGVTSITGGTNITASASTGAVTISTTANPTFATSVTSPLHIGGTTASSTLTLQSTSGVGTSDAISFKVGNNGATTAMTINTSGNVGIGTTSPGANNKLDIVGGNLGLTKTSGTPVSFILSNQAAGYNPPQFQLVRYGAGATATPDNSTIGEIRFDGLNAAGTYDNMGMIQVTSGVNAAGGAPSNMIFSTASSGSAATERMRIDSSGNLGVGTSSPTYQTQIYGSGQQTAALTDAGNKGGSLLLNTPTVSAGDGGALLIGAGGSGAKPFAAIKGLLSNGSNNTIGSLAFATRNATTDTALTERMRIDSDGNVRINTTTDTGSSEKFTVKGATLGTTAGNISVNSAFYTPDVSNTTRILIQDYRVTAGSDHTTSRNLIQRRVDATSMGYLGFDSTATSIGWGTTEAMRIDSSGNVGVGTSSPGAKLDVNGGRSFFAANSEPYSIYLRYNSSTAGFYIGSPAADVMSFSSSGGTERMRIDSSGNVGIGTTGTNFGGTNLQVSAPSSSTYGSILVSSGTYVWEVLTHQTSNIMSMGSRSNNSLAIVTFDTERMRIDTSGNVNIATTGVSAKLYVNGNSASNIAALTDGATITPDFSTANNFSVTIAGNRTLANPTNLIVGQSGVIYVTQDATGSRTLSYGTSWKFPGGTAPTLTTTANAVDALFYVVRTSTSITVNSALNIG